MGKEDDLEPRIARQAEQVRALRVPVQARAKRGLEEWTGFRCRRLVLVRPGPVRMAVRVMMMAGPVGMVVPMRIRVGEVIDGAVRVLGDVAVEMDVGVLAAAMLVHHHRRAGHDRYGQKKQQQRGALTALSKPPQVGGPSPKSRHAPRVPLDAADVTSRWQPPRWRRTGEQGYDPKPILEN